MAKKKTSKPSALHEKPGITDPDALNVDALQSIKKRRLNNLTSEDMVEGIIAGDISALSRAITLIESTNPNHTKKATAVIKGCLPYANDSVRIGITGVPGVGKSTFIETFGTHLINQGKRIAVLAVDPSSGLSKGSILGDKTRMEELVKSKNAFIRPSPSGDSLGGVARKTRETIILCEAAGYDTIIIETVGVGQSEIAVHSMVDFFLLLKLAGAGDELQGIKRGIIEMADAIVINKADGENIKAAKSAKLEFNRALHLYPEKTSGWSPKTAICSALKNEGISEVYDMILLYLNTVKANGFFEENRTNQNTFWLKQTIEEQLKSRFYNQPQLDEELQNQIELIKNRKTTPFAAADYLLGL